MSYGWARWVPHGSALAPTCPAGVALGVLFLQPQVPLKGFQETNLVIPRDGCTVRATNNLIATYNPAYKRQALGRSSVKQGQTSRSDVEDCFFWEGQRTGRGTRWRARGHPARARPLQAEPVGVRRDCCRSSSSSWVHWFFMTAQKSSGIHLVWAGL